jgi:hypothetical protein
MTKLWAITHEVLGEALHRSTTWWILADILSAERKRLIFRVMESSYSLSILLEKLVFAWDPLLLCSLKMTGHAKSMLLLDRLSSWSIFSLTIFGRFETNRTTKSVWCQLVTINSLAPFKSRLLNFFLTIKVHASLKLVSRFLYNYLLFSLFRHLSAYTWFSLGMIVKFWLGFHRSVRSKKATSVIEDQIRSRFAQVFDFIITIGTAKLASRLQIVLYTLMAIGMSTFEDHCFGIDCVERLFANLAKIHYKG